MSSRAFNQDTGAAKREAARGPVVITDRGHPAYVLVTYETFRNLSREAPSLVDLLGQPGPDDIDFDVPARRDVGSPARLD